MNVGAFLRGEGGRKHVGIRAEDEIATWDAWILFDGNRRKPSGTGDAGQRVRRTSRNFGGRS